MNTAWMQTRAFRTAMLGAAALMGAGAAAALGQMGLTQWRASHARKEIAQVRSELDRMRREQARRSKPGEEEKQAEEKKDEGGTEATPTPGPTPTPDVLLDMVREKKLFGTQKRTVTVHGIYGDKVLIGDDWLLEGQTSKDGIKIIEIQPNVVLVDLNGEMLEARPFAPLPGLEGAEASKFRNAPREGEHKGGGRGGDRGGRGAMRGRERDGAGVSAGVVRTPRPTDNEEKRKRREEEVRRDVERQRERAAGGQMQGGGVRPGGGERRRERQR